MKLHLEIGKVRWWLVGTVLAAFIAGAGLGSLIVFAAPTFVRCSFTLPDSFVIPAAS